MKILKGNQLQAGTAECNGVCHTPSTRAGRASQSKWKILLHMVHIYASSYFKNNIKWKYILRRDYICAIWNYMSLALHWHFSQNAACNVHYHQCYISAYADTLMDEVFRLREMYPTYAEAKQQCVQSPIPPTLTTTLEGRLDKRSVINSHQRRQSKF